MVLLHIYGHWVFNTWVRWAPWVIPVVGTRII